MNDKSVSYRLRVYLFDEIRENSILATESYANKTDAVDACMELASNGIFDPDDHTLYYPPSAIAGIGIDDIR